MHAFASFLDRLVLTSAPNAKIILIADYLRSTPDPARGYALAAITGALPLKTIKPLLIHELVASRIDAKLFALSYDYVGDLAETVALIWPARPSANRPLDLVDVVETLQNSDGGDRRDRLEASLDSTDAAGRWALLKLAAGPLRVGASPDLARRALAAFGGAPLSEIEELWHALSPPYLEVFAWLEGRGPKPVAPIKAGFRSVMGAHPLRPDDEPSDAAASAAAAITPQTFAAEWKWDGVRVQLNCEDGVSRLFTQSGDDISEAFPDVIDALTVDASLDGELLVRSPGGGVAAFSELQHRLNRRRTSRGQAQKRPAFIRAYDLLREGSDDIRNVAFRERRRRLERLVASLASDRIDLSPLVTFAHIAQLDNLRRAPPTPEIEGMMLKRWDSGYLAGRPTGMWFKWKRDPFLINAVLMYAARGQGQRSSYYSELTFGVWRTTALGETLAPIGKASFDVGDDELMRFDRYVRDNTIDRFGPIRAVTADQDNGLVLEIAFKQVERSPRRKSGIAMRDPRIERIRWDKPATEAERLDALEALIAR